MLRKLHHSGFNPTCVTLLTSIVLIAQWNLFSGTPNFCSVCKNPLYTKEICLHTASNYENPTLSLDAVYGSITFLKFSMSSDAFFPRVPRFMTKVWGALESSSDSMDALPCFAAFTARPCIKQK